MKIVVGHLYPDYLNIYADRGNIAVLSRRASWRGHDLEVRAVSVGDPLRPDEHDLLYVGGGQDREQALVARDLAAKAEDVRRAVDGGAAVLAVCGGYQLLGRSYRDFHGTELPGIGLLPLETVARGQTYACRLREPRRSNPARSSCGSTRACRRRLRQRRRERLRRLSCGPGRRDLPPRAAPAAEPLVRRLAARASPSTSPR